MRNPNQLWTVEEIKALLEKNNAMVCKSLIQIHERQTEDEKLINQTTNNNSIGFNGLDAEIMSNLAKFYIEKKYLSKAQFDLVKRKIMKYAKQLTRIANEKISNQTTETKPVNNPVVSVNSYQIDETQLNDAEIWVARYIHEHGIITNTRTNRKTFIRFNTSDLRDFNLSGNESNKELETIALDYLSDIHSEMCEDMAARKRGDYDHLDDYNY